MALDRLGEIARRLRGVGKRRAARARQFVLDHVDGDDLLGIDRRKTPHQVLELAHIARPVIPLQTLDGRRLEALRRQPFARGDGEEVTDEIGNVVEPFAQRRQADRHDVEAVEQILAEQTLVDLLLQIAIGRGDDPDIRS